MHTDLALRTYLLSAYTPREFAILAADHWGDDLFNRLPSHLIAPNDFFFEAVLAMKRLGLVHAGLFSILAADLPLRANDVAELRAVFDLPASVPGPDVSAGQTARQEELAALVAAFNREREVDLSGPEKWERINARTARLDEMALRMAGILADLHAFDLHAALWAPDLGTRMTAYLDAMYHVRVEHFNSLAAALLLHEDEPFGDYWALRSLAVLARSPAGVRAGSRVKARLAAEEQRFCRQADRRAVYHAVLEQL